MEKVALKLPSGATLLAARKRISKDLYSDTTLTPELDIMDACAHSPFFIKYHAASSTSLATHHELLLHLYEGDLQHELVSLLLSSMNGR